MSKSLGNVISPKQMVERYGTDSTRLLLISLGTFNEDMDVSWQRLDEIYTASLVNGLGNLCSRVAKMAADEGMMITPPPPTLNQDYQKLMSEYQLTAAAEQVLDQVTKADIYLSQKKPWKLSGKEKTQVLEEAITRISQIAFHLNPFMPETSEKITTHFQDKIQPIKPLFPRLES